MPDFCPEGQIPSLETGNCKELGDACPSGDWPDKLAQGQNIIYVKPGSNGDGKKTSPFGSIQKAVTNAKESSASKNKYQDKNVTIAINITKGTK